MSQQQRATSELRRMLRWIALLGVLMVAGALVYLRLTGVWSLHAVVATILGVLFSVLLGCGLFALAFFSDKSGHDASVNRATRDQRQSDERGD